MLGVPMDQDKLEEKLNGILGGLTDGKTYEELKDTKINELGIDSIAFVDLIFEIEDEFDVHVDDESINDDEQTLAEFIEKIQTKKDA